MLRVCHIASIPKSKLSIPGRQEFVKRDSMKCCLKTSIMSLKQNVTAAPTPQEAYLMHMSTQSFNAMNAIGGLVANIFAFVILGAIGVMIWQGGTQEASWYKRVVALGVGLGFWLMGGTFLAGMIELFLDTFHRVSPAQNKLFEHLISVSLISSLILVIGGSTIGVLMDGAFADKKP